MKLLLRATLVALLAALALAQGPKPGTVTFRGKSYEPAALPADAGTAAKSAVATWAPWAKTHGYRLDLDPSRRVLLLSAKSSVDAQLALVLKTLAVFDSLFPATVTPGPAEPAAEPSKTPAPPAGAKPSPDEIPEDPESPPPGAPKTLPPARDTSAKAVPVEAPFRPDASTAVMLIAKNTSDYVSAMELISAAHPYLADWKEKATPQIGFALHEPLCGAYNENSPEQEEWNPDNELVHRTMALLVLRRFSALEPYWLQTGLCWYAEITVTKSVYCMPYRDGFVAIGEHGGWDSELNSIYNGRSREPLRMDELVLQRGKWDDKASKTAWGMVDFMAKTNPRALPSLMEELRRYIDSNGRNTKADGTWTRIPEYEPPGADLKVLLERYYGATVLSDVIRHWTGE